MEVPKARAKLFELRLRLRKEMNRDCDAINEYFSRIKKVEDNVLNKRANVSALWRKFFKIYRNVGTSEFHNFLLYSVLIGKWSKKVFRMFSELQHYTDHSWTVRDLSAMRRRVYWRKNRKDGPTWMPREHFRYCRQATWRHPIQENGVQNAIADARIRVSSIVLMFIWERSDFSETNYWKWSKAAKWKTCI